MRRWFADLWRKLWEVLDRWDDESEPAPQDPLLFPARAELQFMAAWWLLGAAGISAVMLVIFGRDLKETAIEAAAGTVVFAIVVYIVVVRQLVPRGELGPPPWDVEIISVSHTSLRETLVPALVVALVAIPAIWLLDRWGVSAGGFVFPGHQLGMALAALIGAALARRWERRHGGRALASYGYGRDDKPVQYVLNELDRIEE